MLNEYNPTIKYPLKLSLLLLLIGCTPKENPQLNWYKGNLHTHSYWSDGDDYPEMIIDWYKSNGYNFVALSDHNILAEGDKWINVTNSKIDEDGFENYLARFGQEWVNHTIDSGRIQVKLKTYEEYKYLFEEDGSFLLIQSEEITDNFKGKPIHLNATNIQNFIPPQGGIAVADVMQRNIDAVLKQRAETKVPIFPHINHPNFHYAITAQDMISLRGERFFEVYNGHPMVHNYGDSLHPGTEGMWDIINIAYLKRGQQLLYGLATDDSHNYHQFGADYSNAGRGWVMVQADTLSAGSLIRAMEAGNFYASTGVVLEEVRKDNNTLSIRINAEDSVRYSIEFVGLLKGQDQVQVLKKSGGTEASFDILPEHIFIRARILSDKLKPNPFRHGDYEMAWTQPLTFQTP